MGFRREIDLATEQMADALVAKADPQNGNLALEDGTGALAEVARPLGVSRPGRDYNVVEVV
jgi:hypothetical protein